MPTYEYSCSACDTTHEVVQKMTDPTLTVCPSCGEPRLRKLFSGVGIHFKGSGFYRTDSRDTKSSTSAGNSGGKESGGTDSGGSGGKDSGASTAPAAAPSSPSSSSPSPAPAATSPS